MDVDFSQFLDFYCQEDRYSFRHFDNRSLKKRFARTDVLKNSFFHRIVDKWNILPYEIRFASNVCIFKSKVVKFLSNVNNIHWLVFFFFIYFTYIYIYFLYFVS